MDGEMLGNSEAAGEHVANLAALAKLIKTYLALYRAEGNPLDLAKARALGDAIVRIQRPSGYIPPEYALVEKRDDPMQGWLNCTCASLAALDELAALDGEFCQG